MRGAPRAQHPRTRIIPVLAICVALCAAARADDAELGREVYDDFCVTCHTRENSPDYMPAQYVPKVIHWDESHTGH